MSSVKKLFCLLPGLLLFFSASAGPLGDFSRELDFLELSIVHAALQSKESPNHQLVERRLWDFHSSLSRFHDELKRKKVPNIPNFLKSSAGLKTIFSRLNFLEVTSRLPRFKGTGLSGYYREHQKYLRQTNSGKRSSKREYPTLKTVNLDNYTAWLEASAQNYIQNLRKFETKSTSKSRTKKGKSKRAPAYTRESVRQQLEEYVQYIIELRICFVKVAQNKYYKE